MIGSFQRTKLDSDSIPLPTRGEMIPCAWGWKKAQWPRSLHSDTARGNYSPPFKEVSWLG